MDAQPEWFDVQYKVQQVATVNGVQHDPGYPQELPAKYIVNVFMMVEDSGGQFSMEFLSLDGKEDKIEDLRFIAKVMYFQKNPTEEQRAKLLVMLDEIQAKIQKRIDNQRNLS